MKPALIFALAAMLLACSSDSKTGTDAGNITPTPDARQPTGAFYAGTVTASGQPVNTGTIELIWDGGTADVPFGSDGTFSYEFPELGVDYQAIIPGPAGHWGHSSWLRDVPAEGYTEINYDLGDDGFFDGFSNVLGDPRLAEDGGIISLEIQINEGLIDGQGFTIDAAADPIFVFNSAGVPTRSDVLIAGGAGLLLFGNVAPQVLAQATPNTASMDANCAQADPASDIRAKTLTILVVECQAAMASEGAEVLVGEQRKVLTVGPQLLK